MKTVANEIPPPGSVFYGPGGPIEQPAPKSYDRLVDGWWCACGMSERTKMGMRESVALARLEAHRKVARHG